MGRPALGLKYVQVGLREESLAEIDGLVGNGGRAEFIRDAVDAALGQKKNSIVPAGVTNAYLKRAEADINAAVKDAIVHGASVMTVGVDLASGPDFSVKHVPRQELVREVEDAPKPAKPKGRDLAGDYQRVLSMLGDAVRAVRPLAADLGWEQMRLERVLGKMADAGLVVFSGGAVKQILRT